MVFIQEINSEDEATMGRSRKQPKRAKKDTKDAASKEDKPTSDDETVTKEANGKKANNDSADKKNDNTSPNRNTKKTSNETNFPPKDAEKNTDCGNCGHCKEEYRQQSSDRRVSPEMVDRRSGTDRGRSRDRRDTHESRYGYGSRSRESKGRSGDRRDTQNSRYRSHSRSGDKRGRSRDRRDTQDSRYSCRSRSGENRGCSRDRRDTTDSRRYCDVGDRMDRRDSHDRQGSVHSCTMSHSCDRRFSDGKRVEREDWNRHRNNDGRGYRGDRDYRGEYRPQYENRRRYNDEDRYWSRNNRNQYARSYDNWRPNYRKNTNNWNGNQPGYETATTSKESETKFEESTKNLEKKVGQVGKTVFSLYQMLKYGGLHAATVTPTPPVPAPTPTYNTPATHAYNYYQQLHLPQPKRQYNNILENTFPQPPFATQIGRQVPPFDSMVPTLPAMPEPFPYELQFVPNFL